MCDDDRADCRVSLAVRLDCKSKDGYKVIHYDNYERLDEYVYEINVLSGVG